MVKARPAQHRKNPLPRVLDERLCRFGRRQRQVYLPGGGADHRMRDKPVRNSVEIVVPPAAHRERLRVQRHPAVDVVVAFATCRLPAGEPGPPARRRDGRCRAARAASRANGSPAGIVRRSGAFTIVRPRRWLALASASAVSGRTVRPVRFWKGRRSCQSRRTQLPSPPV